MLNLSFNRWCSLISVFFFSVVIAGCVKRGGRFAPVLNGWLQPDAKGFYRVKKMDTIYSIAWAFGLDYRALAEANHLSTPYAIRAGELLHMTNAPPIYGQKIASLQPAQKSDQVLPLWQHLSLIRSRSMSSHWQWPVKGRIINRYSGTMEAGTQGIDITGYYGEPIHAASGGIVVYSGPGVRGYGNLIIIKHNQNYLSTYAFNKQIFVKKGNKVRIGQEIAEMGRTDSGCIMLHFEIRRNGKPVNPLFYLSSNGI